MSDNQRQLDINEATRHVVCEVIPVEQQRLMQSVLVEKGADELRKAFYFINHDPLERELFESCVRFLLKQNREAPMN